MAMKHSRAFIKVDGAMLETLPKPKLNMGGVKRTAVLGDNKVMGFTESLDPGGIECEVSLGQGMSVAELGAITGATITYEADTGQTFVIRNGFVTDTLQVSPGDNGAVKLVFAGDPAEELQ